MFEIVKTTKEAARATGTNAPKVREKWVFVLNQRYLVR